MSEYFKNWNEIKVDGSTVSFYKNEENGVEYIGFDSSSCMPPEPMVNALAGLNLVTDKSKKLVMINHKFPAGLIPKVSANFNYETVDLDNGFVKVIFSIKDNVEPTKFDTNVKCHG